MTIQYPSTLQESVNNLYEIFQRYPLRNDMPACPCCVTKNDIQCVCSKLLKNLLTEDLDHYVFKAVSTWGDEKDFKHFLPRIFDLLPSFEFLTDVEVIFGKLDYVKWQSWPLDEREAVENYLKKFWERILTQYPLPEGQGIGGCVYGLSITIGSENLFSVWEKAENIEAAQHLADFIIDETDLMRRKSRRRLDNAFWDGHEEDMNKIIDRLLQKQIEEKLEKLFYVNEKSACAAKFAEATDRIKLLNKNFES